MSNLNDSVTVSEEELEEFARAVGDKKAFDDWMSKKGEHVREYIATLVVWTSNMSMMRTIDSLRAMAAMEEKSND